MTISGYPRVAIWTPRGVCKSSDFFARDCKVPFAPRKVRRRLLACVDAGMESARRVARAPSAWRGL